MTRILAINGAYRAGGITDQAVEAATEAARAAGAEVEVVLLRDYPIEFCLNCRVCTQQPGEAPAKCVQQDAMQALIDKLEGADAYILASPTNLGSVTALFKRFMERLIVYAYWPQNSPAPQYRKAHARRKKALLISSCAAPGLLGRWLFGTCKQLRMTAKILGANPVGTVFTGLIGRQDPPLLPNAGQRKVQALAARLL